MATLHRDAAARSPCPNFLNRSIGVIPYPFIESLLCAESIAEVKSSATIRDGSITVGSFCGPHWRTHDGLHHCIFLSVPCSLLSIGVNGPTSRTEPKMPEPPAAHIRHGDVKP